MHKRMKAYIWKTFGFPEIKAYLSTRPAKAVGDPARWEQAQKSLVQAIQGCGLEYEVDEGGGAFYGPKIDLKIKDAIGREWQTSTIQFDFNLPERFDMSYVGEDGQKHQPFMVHRALFGSLERFFGILIEQYAGAFPMWLAPEQARILPITQEQIPFAEKQRDALRAKGFRVEFDSRSASLGAKIKDARNARIPYILVVGAQEAADGRFSVRSRREGELGAMTLDDLAKKMQSDVDNKIC